MLTGKQRAYLKSLATDMDPTVYIGKDELGDNIINEMDKYLDAHEMVKVKIQEGSTADPKETANECANILKAEYVQAIGRKFVLYRPAKKKEDSKIVLPR